jgi:hypothetical protein
VDIPKRVLTIRGTQYDQYSQIETLIPTTIAECKKALHTTQIEVSRIAQQSAQYQEDKITSKVAALELEGNTKRTKILRNIQKAEEMKKLFSKIRYLRTPERQTGVSSIQVPVIPTENPKECKDWITVDAPNEVVKKL